MDELNSQLAPLESPEDVSFMNDMDDSTFTSPISRRSVTTTDGTLLTSPITRSMSAKMQILGRTSSSILANPRTSTPEIIALEPDSTWTEDDPFSPTSRPAEPRLKMAMTDTTDMKIRRGKRKSRDIENVSPRKNIATGEFCTPLPPTKRRSTSTRSVISLADVSVLSKKKRKLSHFASLATIASPRNPMAKIKRAFQRSVSSSNNPFLSPRQMIDKVSDINSSMLNDSILTRTMSSKSKKSTTTSAFWLKVPSPVPPTTPESRNRNSRLHQRDETTWAERYQYTLHDLSSVEVKRQEAVHELYRGEENFLKDLNLVATAYQDPMRQLNILKEEEIKRVFGNISELSRLHELLVERLKRLRGLDGVTNWVGACLIEWIPRLEQCYVSYCSGQHRAKLFLDKRKTCDPKLDEFLRRCQQSPFSRKLDLWDFLDSPRSRLVKYPLLIKRILEYTPLGHDDVDDLKVAIKLMDNLIEKVDAAMGKTGKSKPRSFRNQRTSFLREN